MNSTFRAGSFVIGIARWVLASVSCALSFPAASAAEILRLQILAGAGKRPLVLNEKVNVPPNGSVSISRLDFLLSALALQRADGSWLEAPEWHAFLSAGKDRLTAIADGIPAEDFRAIRFRVGVDPATNRSDPNQRQPEDPLHPDVCGLHWGWQGGYVFLAIEGHWLRDGQATGGFSFHLAGDENATFVELPVRFRGGGPNTLQIAFDAAKLIAGIDFQHDGASTHSRAGDPLAARLKANLAAAFQVRAVKTDLYQEITGIEPRPAGAVGTTRYSLEISQRLPKVKLPTDNLLTVEGVELGRRLFNDPRLSINNSQSCASCHDRTAAFADVRRLSPGAEGQPGRRHAMPLFNLAWAQSFFWDGRAPTLRAQALVPIEDAHEMKERLDHVIAKLGADREYPTLFRRAFGATGDQITPAQIGLAIEQFLLTLVSQESKFDRAARGLETLTEQEKDGLRLFVTENDPRTGLRGADCFHCHGGNLFTNHQFANNGLAPRDGDLGRMEVTGNASDEGKFKVPSLRNVAVTGPYMHDGRFTTLEEVIDHYDHGVLRSPTLDPNLAKHPDTGLGLSAADKTALLAFLRTLTDDAFIGRQPLPASPPTPALTQQ